MDKQKAKSIGSKDRQRDEKAARRLVAALEWEPRESRPTPPATPLTIVIGGRRISGAD